MGASLLITLVALVSQETGAREEALAHQVARSVDLFTTYTGRWPTALEELKRKPGDVRFWPDGGFWIGPLPESVRWEKGSVSCGNAKVTPRPPFRSPIIPPTERLKQHFTARIQIQLMRHAARAYQEEHDRLPANASELGGILKDPWGAPYVVEFLEDRLRIRSRTFLDRLLGSGDVTPEERRRLDEGAAVSFVSDEDVRAIRNALDRMADDDYETRLEAAGELRNRGPVVRTFLLARLGKAKDPFVRRWLHRLKEDFPEHPSAWIGELRPLSTVMMTQVDPKALEACNSALRQLWMMQQIYRSQYGGRMKRMPKELGRDFWLALSRTAKPLIDPRNQDLFVCPASGLEAAKDRCTYAGPGQDVNRPGDPGRIVGLCDREEHGDRVVILRHNGSLDIEDRHGPAHQQALKETKR